MDGRRERRKNRAETCSEYYCSPQHNLWDTKISGSPVMAPLFSVAYFARFAQRVFLLPEICRLALGEEKRSTCKAGAFFHFLRNGAPRSFPHPLWIIESGAITGALRMGKGKVFPSCAGNELPIFPSLFIIGTEARPAGAGPESEKRRKRGGAYPASLEYGNRKEDMT